jgi:Na+-translocating ferredoxin:NAD+ oxidoreductase RnfA subunit
LFLAVPIVILAVSMMILVIGIILQQSSPAAWKKIGKWYPWISVAGAFLITFVVAISSSKELVASLISSAIQAFECAGVATFVYEAIFKKIVKR